MQNNNEEMSIKKVLPLSIQHLLAMFVAIIVPPLLIANVANVGVEGTTILIQAALFASAIGTFIQIFPIPLMKNFKTGSGLPMMMGMNYVFLGISISVAGQYGLSALFGGLIVSSIFGIFMVFFIKKVIRLFTPLVSGVLVTCMGIGLYQPAINNLAGGLGSPTYGEPINFFIGSIVVFIIVIFIKFGKGTVKDTAILLGIIIGYIFSLFLGIVDFSAFKSAQWFAFPKLFSYGVEFNLKVIVVFIIAYAIAIIDFMGCCTVTTLGGYGRELEGEEYANGIIGGAIASIIAAIFGAIPVAGLSQNAAILSMNKRVNRLIFFIGGILVFMASISPKLASLLISIPNAVMGGATIVVFGMITMAGVMLITMLGFDDETKLIAGVSIASSIGISSIPSLLNKFPETIQILVGESSIISGVVIALAFQELFKFFDDRKLKKRKL